MNYNNLWPAQATIDNGDWRIQLPNGSRQRIVEKILETLVRHLPNSGQEGLQDLKRIAMRFEEKIYTSATSQSDYLRRISIKMITMGSKSQNPTANFLPSNNNPPDAGVMSPLSKYKKTSKELETRQHEDRITDLPESLIAKILSCLTTKDAVATSILSKKWKSSWTLVTNLNFDDHRLSHYSSPNCGATAYRKFTNFVSRMLLVRDKSFLQRIRVDCHCRYDDSLVNTWLIAISQCNNVQELDITIAINHPGLLPSGIFLCNTLVVLKLNMAGFVHIPFSACLPRLKTLYISGLQLSDDMSITNLLSGSPLLEELTLSLCVGNDVRVINISARFLKSLTVEYLSYSRPDRLNNFEYHIVINTPALKHLKFCDFLTKVYQVSKMDHLIKAEVELLFIEDHSHSHQFREMYSKAVHEFFYGISEVEILVLAWQSTSVICSCQVVLPKFSNLTYLKLNTGTDFLPKFLGNSPRLETLYIEQADGFNDGLKFDTLAFDNVPSCFVFHLKEIVFKGFTGSEDEMEVIKYFLENAQVLKNLTLITPEDVIEHDVECVKALLLLPRASTICKVVVDYWS